MLEMLELTAPFMLAAFIAAVVAFCRKAQLRTADAMISWKVCFFEAVICGCGALAVSVVAKNHWESYSYGDSLAIAFVMGLMGVGRISDLAVNIFNRKIERS